MWKLLIISIKMENIAQKSRRMALINTSLDLLPL